MPWGTKLHASKTLKSMLRKFTPGSILHLLADHYREQADEANRYEDAISVRRKVQEPGMHALYVVGLGLDGQLVPGRGTKSSPHLGVLSLKLNERSSCPIR